MGPKKAKRNLSYERLKSAQCPWVPLQTPNAETHTEHAIQTHAKKNILSLSYPFVADLDNISYSEHQSKCYFISMTTKKGRHLCTTKDEDSTDRGALARTI